MAIDAYSICPGSGQKIKFCCGKSIISDLSQIFDQSNSGQIEAALDRLDHTIAKAGQTDCLAVIKTQMLLEMDRREEADIVNKELLESTPKHPLGLQQRAVIEASNRNLPEAISYLQDSIEQFKGSEIPVTFAKTYRMLALILFFSGHVTSALAHLRFGMILADDEEREGFNTDMRKMLEPTPWLLKQPMVPAPNPDGVEWNKLYDNVPRAIARGQFRRAFQLLKKIDTDFPDQPVVVEALAMVGSMILDADVVSNWRRYADLPNVSRARKIEALALANLIDQEPATTTELLDVSFTIKNFDLVVETMIANDHFSEDRRDQLRETEEAVPPRHAFILYSRGFRQDEEYTDDYRAAQHSGVIRVYGKRTDREALLNIRLFEHDVENVKAQLVELFGDAIAEDPAIENVGQVDSELAVLDRSIEIPRNLTPSQMNDLRRRELDSQIIDQWAQLPWSGNDSLTIAEAAQQEESVDEIYAKFIVTVFEIPEYHEREEFDRVREKMGLPVLDAIDGDLPRAKSSPLFLQLIDIAKLPTVDLGRIIDYMQQVQVLSAVRPFVDEILGREDMDAKKETDYKMLRARSSEEPEEAIKFLEEALAAAEPGSMQEAVCRVERLKAFLVFQDLQKAQEELSGLRPFLQIPYVNFMVATILTEMGLLRPDIPLEAQIPESPAPQVAPSSTIIDPSASPQTSSESKLWIPD